MNQSAIGPLSDRVFISFHSNAGGGRGVTGLYNGNNDINTRTPNQILLARSLGQEVNDDLVAQAGQYEHNWFDNGTNTILDRSDIEFGEINNLYINNEFDATIVEVAYHDNRARRGADAQPKGPRRRGPRHLPGASQVLPRRGRQHHARHRVAHGGHRRAGRLQRGRQRHALLDAADLELLPRRRRHRLPRLRLEQRLCVRRRHGRRRRRTTSVTLSGYDPSTPYYFKVVAVNAGGESPGSEVMAALPNGGPKQVLIVSGFDRLDRTEDPKQPFAGAAGNTVDRVRPRQSNSRDYTAQVAAALQAARPGVRFDSTSNEAVISAA